MPGLVLSRILGSIAAGLGVVCIWLSAVSAAGGITQSEMEMPPAQITNLSISELQARQTITTTTVGSCDPWVQVNADAFGLGDPANQVIPYANEDVFETVVFQNQLYLGMEADNRLGARLWRTRPNVLIPRGQADWEEVLADTRGYPLSITDTARMDHVDSLAVFNQQLFVSFANRSGYPVGTSIYRSTDGLQWTPVMTNGFGQPANENFKAMVNYPVGGVLWLCGGTWNDATGGQVYCSKDGNHWLQVNANGFGARRNSILWSSLVFDGALYFGTQCDENGSQSGGACPGAVYRSWGPDLDGNWNWTRVFTGVENTRAMLAGPFQNALFVVQESDQGSRLYRSTSGDPGSFIPVANPGFGDPHNGRTPTDGNAVYNGALYLAVSNPVRGGQIWRTADGLQWTAVITQGLGKPGTLNANLIPFNGYLFAWAENYLSGQEVLRSACPVQQNSTIQGPGIYALPAAGTVLSITDSTLKTVQVRAYPRAFPLASLPGQPFPRFLTFDVLPSGAKITATVTITYTPVELQTSGLRAVADELILTVWDESQGIWRTCPVAARHVDLVSHSVSCANLHILTSLAIIAPYDGRRSFLPWISTGGP